jgi:hypothetical protein
MSAKPWIEHYYDAYADDLVWRLRVPKSVLIYSRRPRLRVALFMLRTTWQVLVGDRRTNELRKKGKEFK